jgi:uncharacterized membrane-anchored protein
MKWPALLPIAFLPVTVLAQDSTVERPSPEAFLASLHSVSGSVGIGDGIATLQLPDSYRYLDPEGSRRLLVDAWGNPPDAVEGTLGVLFPTSTNLLSAEGWAVIISYDKDGYVDDAGAEAINYDSLLHQMREATGEANKERTRQGYPAVDLIGWATPPHYNRDTHKLYWAKELAFSGDPSHTLNYGVRVLGRRGVLVLNAVAPLEALPRIEQSMQSVIGYVQFNEGHRYQDFIPGTDKKAAYGVAGLIAGAVAAKAGFFKLLWVAILALKKFIIAGVAALGVVLRRVFKKQATPTPTPPA